MSKQEGLTQRKLRLRSRWRVQWHNWRIRLALRSRKRLRLELAQYLDASLNGLHKRLTKRHIPALCALTIAQESNIRSLASEDPQERRATFAVLLVHAVDRLLLENQQGRARFNSLSRQCALVFDERAYFALIEDYLQQNAKSTLEYLADRRALTRRFDLDALRERNDERCHRNRVMIEIAISCIAQLWLQVVRAPGHEGSTGQARALQSQPQLDLIRFFFSIEQATTQIRIADQITALISTGVFAPLEPTSIERFATLVKDPEQHPWLRRHALRIIHLSAPKRGLELCEQLLSPKENEARNAFVLRTLLIQDLTRLCERDAQALSLLQAHWFGIEPSEHVRICLAQCIAGLPADPMDLVSWLAKRVCLHRSDTPSETSRKVRAMALDSITSILLDQVEQGLYPAESQTLQFAAQALDSSLQDELDPWVCVQSCRQMRRVLHRIIDAHHPDHFRALFRAWSHSLRYRSSDPQSPLQLANEASACLDLMDIALDPEARAAFGEMKLLMLLLQPGRRKSFKKSPALCRVSRDRMGQICALLSRDNWGLYLDLGEKKIHVQRGDRYRMRLWRLFHEARHPSPNKRKGFVHSTGRVFRGKLRAHPFGMDEATATVVPGERVSLGPELGWGRQLPSVDDLLELPMPWRDNAIELHSSYGTTTIRTAPGLWSSCLRWLKISLNYAKLARLRQSALQAKDPNGRCAFVAHLKERYQIEVSFSSRSRVFESKDYDSPAAILELFDTPPRSSTPASTQSTRPGMAASFAPFALIDFNPLTWLQENAYYFFSKQGNDQNSLSLFLSGALGLFLFQGYWRRRSIRIARDKIPLSIGGWGTRGKSGTERLKAALFHGLGYRVFSKTTGCEAMLIHSMAQGPQSEIFVFRPYGKATIWEQATLLKLAANLDADVFLWECMALNPTYVSILQHGWMNDDLATITNAYPDHEDIQGPAGHNVAKVISTFIPKRSIALSSEINFHPMMRDRARAQSSEYHWVKPDQEAWIGDDFLALFPYQEHPRNIALVAQMGERLGIDPDLCVYNMATQVVPDLGVLKTYGDILVKGRALRFINGCSANERAGFLNNWTRSGCDRLDPNAQPERMLATVVNNRADRVSRSEVFARILVNDAVADKHVLIGTNLSGLLGYLREALSEYLSANPLCAGQQAADKQGTLRRFDEAMARFRSPHPSARAWLSRLELYGRAAGLALAPQARAQLEALLLEIISNAQALPASLAELRAHLESFPPLLQAVNKAWTSEGQEAPSSITECLAPPSPDEIYPHWCQLLAKCLLIHRLRQTLIEALEQPSAFDAAQIERAFQASFLELFEDSLHPIPDPDIKGDQIIVRCAELFPPGVQLTLLGSQNIKGTGLDLVYRWVALDQVQQELGRLSSTSPQIRDQALTRLEAFGDHGLLDLGLLKQTLPTLRAKSASESAAMSRLAIKVQERYGQARRALISSSSARRGFLPFVLDWLEGWIDFLDGARRYHQSKSLSRDLVHGRVSHGRATLEMREICGRSKGGWLAKWWSRSQDEP